MIWLSLPLIIFLVVVLHKLNPSRQRLRLLFEDFEEWKENKIMEEDEFNVDLPSEPTDADLDTIESGDDNWTWDQDAIVFDDEEVIH